MIQKHQDVENTVNSGMRPIRRKNDLNLETIDYNLYYPEKKNIYLKSFGFFSFITPRLLLMLINLTLSLNKSPFIDALIFIYLFMAIIVVFKK